MLQAKTITRITYLSLVYVVNNSQRKRNSKFTNSDKLERFNNSFFFLNIIYCIIYVKGSLYELDFLAYTCHYLKCN